MMYLADRLTMSRFWTPIARAALLLPLLVALALPLWLGAAVPVRAAAGPAGKIAFMSNRSGNEDIWLMNGDGTNPTQLTTAAGVDSLPNWSPDGTRIAFHSNRDGDYDIYVMDADGSNQTNLTNSSAGNDSVPTWSPDGSRIAFSSGRSGNGDIWIMDADGSNPTQLTTNPATDYFPDWSPLGTRIIFRSHRDGHAEVYIIDPNGNNETRLTFSDAGFEAADGAFSPDGLKIAFTISSTSAPFNGNFYVMNADGSGVQQITTFSAPDDVLLARWTPDGTKLLYSGYPDAGGLWDIYTINADGSDAPVNLTNLGTADDRYADQQPLRDIFVSTSAAGVIGAVTYGPHDVLKWDGEVWSKWFDGTAAGLTPNGKAAHNVNAVYIPNDGSRHVLISFAQNARFVPGISGKVDGMDLVWWDGSAFSLWFDGQDVGLTNKSQEKIDALHVLDGSLSPVGGGCSAYLLISTQGPGQVPGVGGPIKFSGEDVLGFCLINSGAATTGVWHKLIDGSNEGIPRNSTASLSASVDGQTIYLTTRGAFNVDSAAGGHSMVYEFDLTGGAFSGPVFVAADEGLNPFVDALQY